MQAAKIFSFNEELLDGETESNLLFLVFPVEVTPFNIWVWDLASSVERTRIGWGPLLPGRLFGDDFVGGVAGEGGSSVPARDEL